MHRLFSPLLILSLFMVCLFSCSEKKEDTSVPHTKTETKKQSNPEQLAVTMSARAQEMRKHLEGYELKFVNFKDAQLHSVCNYLILRYRAANPEDLSLNIEYFESETTKLDIKRRIVAHKARNTNILYILQVAANQCDVDIYTTERGILITNHGYKYEDLKEEDRFIKCQSHPITSPNKDTSQAEHFRERLRDYELMEVDFDNITLRHAVDYLRLRYREMSEEERGISIKLLDPLPELLRDPDAPNLAEVSKLEDRTLTFKAKKTNMLEIWQTIADQCSVDLYITKCGIIITDHASLTEIQRFITPKASN